MTTVKYSDEVAILKLSEASADASELDEIISSASMGYWGHFCVDLSLAGVPTRETVLTLLRLHYALCLRGHKLVLFGLSLESRNALAKMALINQFDIAADQTTALRWVGITEEVVV